MASNITLSEWRAELERLESAQERVGKDNGWHCSEELREILGMGRQRLTSFLAALKRAGRLESQRVRRERVDGAYGSVPVYRLKHDDKVKAKSKKR